MDYFVLSRRGWGWGGISYLPSLGNSASTKNTNGGLNFCQTNKFMKKNSQICFSPYKRAPHTA